jgi:type II secretory pathway pseudopilin PulG
MKKRTFTLVELLIVIGIIIILSGVLLPVLVGAGKKADQTKAKAEITTLVNAIKQFESTYGVLPVPDGAGEALTDAEYTQLILILQAEDTADDASSTALTAANATKNSRKVKFLDVVGNVRGVYPDPWDNNYTVFLDDDYDGEIATIPDGVSVASPLRYSIVAWSTGPDGASSSSAKDKSNRDNVYSFSTSWSKATGHTIER